MAPRARITIVRIHDQGVPGLAPTGAFMSNIELIVLFVGELKVIAVAPWQGRHRHLLDIFCAWRATHKRIKSGSTDRGRTTSDKTLPDGTVGLQLFPPPPANYSVAISHRFPESGDVFPGQSRFCLLLDSEGIR